MGKITLNELVDLLAKKAHISKREAQQFIAAVIETIQEGVNADKQVKIKGLGTFKVVDVDARESVNVNTGERVTIESHQKLSFTPDAAMKELVNRPFSQFETVVLNEGVEFDEETMEEPSVTEEEESATPAFVAPVVEETKAEETVVEESAPVVEEPQVEEAPVVEETPVVEEPQVEETPVAEEEEIEACEDDEEDEEPKTSSYWWAWLLLAIAACIASFAGGYLYGRHMDRVSLLEEENSADTTSVVAPVEKDTLKKDTLLVDTTASIKQDTTKTELASVPEVKAPEPKVEAEPDWKKYEKMDVRVRTGAYGIIGTDRMEKVRPGDTTKRIAKRTLGEGMECYIEVYNNVKTEDLKEGHDIKIPKLKLKKFLRNETNKK